MLGILVNRNAAGSARLRDRGWFGDQCGTGLHRRQGDALGVRWGSELRIQLTSELLFGGRQARLGMGSSQRRGCRRLGSQVSTVFDHKPLFPFTHKPERAFRGSAPGGHATAAAKSHFHVNMHFETSRTISPNTTVTSIGPAMSRSNRSYGS